MGKLSTRLILYLCILYVSGSAVVADDSGDARYMAIFLNGKKVGHSISTRTVIKDRVITTEEMTFTVYRGAQPTRIYTKETNIETVEGRPLGFEMIQNQSGSEEIRSGAIGPEGKMEVTINKGGIRQTYQLMYPTGSLMPEGMRLLQQEKDLATGVEFEAMLFRPDMLEHIGGVLPVTVRGGPKKQIDLLGKKVEALETTTTMKIPVAFGGQAITITTTNYCDEELEPLKILAPFMDMTLEMIACEKEVALRPEDVFDFLSMVTVACPVSLPPLDTVSAVTYELAILSSEELYIPSGDNQTVQKPEANRLLVTVRPAIIPTNAAFPYAGTDPNILQAMQPTEYLQSDDPKIIDMAKTAVASATDAGKAAKQIEAFVKGYIQTKDFSIGYASARQVADSRQGDCSEHAVLTAAMCRAVGIPARVVSGLVYTENLAGQNHVFGGHAWTEAYIGGKWIGLDATRSPQGYGPGHIILAYGHGNPNDFLNLIKVLGAFKIEKVTIQTQVPETVKNLAADSGKQP